jgi:Protein of unknown function (DUF3800)
LNNCNLQAYFDESGTHDDADVMVMAGYLMTPCEAANFNDDWSACLKTYDVACSHMVDLAHKKKRYVGWPDDQRKIHTQELISIIHQHSRFGFAVTIDKKFYDTELDRENGSSGFFSAYSFCALKCLDMIRDWCEKSRYEGKIEYIFEAGHKHQAELDRIFKQMEPNESFSERYRFGGHSFIAKDGGLPLQAADMLAWQVHHYHQRCIKGEQEPRKDYLTLVRKSADICHNFSRDSLETIRSGAEQRGFIPPPISSK